MDRIRRDLLCVQEVADRLGVGRRTVWKLVRDGDLPGPVRLGKGRIVRWRASDIDAFVEALGVRRSNAPNGAAAYLDDD
jgi:excisionase family DNA binding protein